MAALFVAQATDTPMTLWEQLGLLAVLLVTSKGAAGVTGSGFRGQFLIRNHADSRNGQL